MQTKEIKEELEEIRQAKKEEKRSKIYRRILAVEKRLQGEKCKEIAKDLSVCLDTVSDWMRIYETGGLEKLRKLNYDGRRISVLEEYKTKIKEHIKLESVRTIEDLQDWLKETHAVIVEQSWLFRFCKKNSIFLSKERV